MILTSMQYVVWESEYLRHAQAAALGGGGAYTVEQLFGSGQFAAVPAQTVLPPATLAVVSECAYRAFLKVPQAGEPADCKRALQPLKATERYTLADMLMLPLFQSLKGPQRPGDAMTLTEFQQSCLRAIMQKLKGKYVDR
ncbi:hypothetical protein E2320_018353 [Naja naja]|nr:hypothetical protein E2320_018353 [Naja naja]